MSVPVGEFAVNGATTNLPFYLRLHWGESCWGEVQRGEGGLGFQGPRAGSGPAASKWLLAVLGDHSHNREISSDVSGTPSWLAFTQRARWQAGRIEHDRGLEEQATKEGRPRRVPTGWSREMT